MAMKKIAALIAGLALAFSLTACSGAPKAAPTNGGAKAQGDSFVVGFDAEFPPFGFKDNSGKFVGFDLDLAQEVAKRNGWEYKPQPIAWDSKDAELGSGQIDCIWNGFTMTGREDKYAWSKPYVNNKIVFVVKADSGIAKPADLAGKVVDVQKDSSGLAALQDPANKALTDSFSTLTQVDDYNTALTDLTAGATAAVAMDSTVAEYKIKQLGADKFTVIDPGFKAEAYGVGFALGKEKLRDQVQKTLDEMAADGTLQKIAEKWGEQGALVK
ncbi:MAG: amino acid ABC transporter substrate-binding protein [Arcanobacterium sp.]|nr:amino acid ABC transporter substrate-binding protein [Arcanobacterium sp.]MDY5588550.1 amino acid ABC transporter substrate-binding protein [Arcanobacterium sp.]